MKESNSLAMKNPELAKQWHPTLNGDLKATDVTPGSNKKVWWVCDKSSLHEYNARISGRFNGTGCPYCAGKKACKDNNLVIKNPELAKEWHPTKNGELQPTDVTPGSTKKVWWICSSNPIHEWNAKVNNRTIGHDCPYCTGRKVCADNNLAFKYPELAKEWHPTKNGNLKATDVTHGSGKKVYWKCSIKSTHEWEARIDNRSKGTACPYCAGRKVEINYESKNYQK